MVYHNCLVVSVTWDTKKIIWDTNGIWDINHS